MSWSPNPSMIMANMANVNPDQPNPNDPLVGMFANSLASSGAGAPQPSQPAQPPAPSGGGSDPLAPSAPVTPVPIGNPAASHQPGLFKKVLMNFMYNGAEALKKQVGLPTDAELNAQRQQQQQVQFAQAMAKRKQAADEANQASEVELRHAQALKAAASESPADEFKRRQTEAASLVSQGLMHPSDVVNYILKKAPATPFTPKTEAEMYLAAANGDPAKAISMQNADKIKNAQAMHDPTLRDMQMQNIQDKRVDQSYKFHTMAMDKIEQPLDLISQRLNRLQTTLGQNSPQADALVAPELLTVMAGGQGSGLRMNEAEIARIIGGRSNWESLKAMANKWATDPAAATSITPSQRQQIRALTTAAAAELQRQQGMISTARTQLSGSNDVNEHKQIYNNLRKSFATPPQPTMDDPKGFLK